MATDILVKVGADITDFSRKMAESSKALSNFTKANQQTFDAFKQTGAVVTGFGVALAGGLGIAVKEAIKFEDSFAGVKKTVDATDAELAVLKQGFRDMAKEIPASVHEINAVGEAAGQLGIKTENILDFTRVMIDLGEATNLTSDEAATAFARFANIVGMSQNDFDKLGSTVVALGNNFATTEAEIVEMSMRLAGVGKQVGMTESDIMALSTAMSSVGIEAEAGGSAMSMAIKKMQNAVSSGGKDLDNFAKAAGMSSKEFADSFNKDPIRALDAFIKGLAKSGEEGENLNEILESVGIKGIREADTMLRLAGASDILSEAVDLASTAWEENTALSDEAAQRYETMASKLKILKNNVIDAAVTFGDALLPAVTAAVEGLQKLAEWFGGLSESTKQFIAVGTAVTAALALIIGPLMLLIGFIPQIISGFGVVMTVVKAVSGVFAALASPIGLTILAIVGIAAAVVIAYKKVEWFRDAVNAAWDWVKEKTMVAFEAVKEAILKAVDAIVEFAKEKLDTLKQFWAENGEQIRQATENVWNFIKGIIEKVMPIIEGIIKAVWFVIQTVVMAVWENIKGVIDGALNVILGLVKTFSSLFTGDWSGMWEGVKQLFSGAIEFLWNAVQLMLWGRLLKGIAVFAGSFRGAVTNMWTSIQAVFTNTINAIKSFFSAGFNAMKGVANTTMSSMRTVISTVWNTIKGVFTNVINSIKTTVSNGFSNVVSAIRTKMSEAVTAVKTKMTEMLGKVTGAAKDFLQAGKDLIQGLIDGITQMTAAAIGAITGVVDSVVNKAKSLLGIKSPSRVFKQIGAWVSEGWANGIDDKGAKVTQAVQDISRASIKIADKYRDEERTITKKHESEVARIKQRSLEDIAKIERTAASKKRKLTEDEAIRIRRIKEDADKKIVDLESKMAKQIADIQKKANKERIEYANDYLERKRKIGEMTLADEARLWNALYSTMQAGTEEYEQAYANHQNTVKTIRDELTKLEDGYVSKVGEINKRLVDDIHKANEEYQKAYESRVDMLRNFVGMFDKFEAKAEITGQDLIANAQSQVDALKQYNGIMNSLWMRTDNQAFMEELEAMGPKVLGELQALNRLSDAELAKYVDLYEEKFELARNQASSELQALKTDTSERIQAMQEVAAKELDALNKQWQADIRKVVQGSAREFDSMTKIGQDAGKGLYNGLDSMIPSLVDKAREMADAIKSTVQSTLDINSPSRVLARLGKWTGEGLAQGIAGTYDMVERASAKLAGAAVPDISMDYATPAGIRSSLSSAVNGTVDVSATENNRLLAEIRDELRRQKQMIVEMDSREVGRAVSPTVDRELGRRQANSARRAFT